MPEFVIEKDMPGLGDMSPFQVQQAARRSCSALHGVAPDIEWVQSYLTDDKVYCVYRAPSEQALREAGLDGDLRDFAQTALGHERQHLAAIQQALGARALPRPTFAFGQRTKSADAFAEAAIELEDIAVAAYNGQAPNLTKATLAPAAEIVSVEARHAAWVRAIVGQVAAPDPVDKPLTAQQAAAGLQRFGVRT